MESEQYMRQASQNIQDAPANTGAYAIISTIGTTAIFAYILFTNIAAEDYLYYPILAITLICFALTKGWNVLKNKNVITFLILHAAFLFWAIILTLNADFALALSFFKGQTMALVGFLFLSSLRSTSKFSTMEIFGYSTFIMMAVVALFYFTSQPEIIFNDIYEKRLRGFAEHSNQFYIILLVPSVMALYCFRYKRIQFFLYSALLFLLVILSGSKTGMAMMAIIYLAFSVSFFLNRKVHIIKKFAASLIFLVISPLIFVLGKNILQTLNPYYYARLEAVLTNLDASSTVIERTQIIDRGLSLFMDNPFVGIGPGQQIRFISVSHFHNFILDYLVTFGIPGTLLVLMMMAFVGVNSIKKAPILLAALLVLILTTLSSDSLGRTFMLFAIIAGIALRSEPHTRQRRASQVNSTPNAA